MDHDTIDATQPRATGAAAEARSRNVWRARSRFAVHLGLLATVAGALATLQMLHIRVAYHADIGLAFGALVIIHLVQRRHRIARMVARLRRAGPQVERELRLVASDAILAFLTLNVVVSGIIDWNRGTPVGLPLPMPFSRWHLASSIVLVVYMVVHVSRRWRRIRRSTVR